MSGDSLYLVECDAGAAAMPSDLLTAHGYDVRVIAAGDFGRMGAGSSAFAVLIATSEPDMLRASDVLRALGGKHARIPAIVIRPGCDFGDAANLLSKGACDIIDGREADDVLREILAALPGRLALPA